MMEKGNKESSTAAPAPPKKEEWTGPTKDCDICNEPRPVGEDGKWVGQCPHCGIG